MAGAGHHKKIRDEFSLVLSFSLLPTIFSFIFLMFFFFVFRIRPKNWNSVLGCGVTSRYRRAD
jgi:uncharacterized membrane protein YjjB (DUF3815 family)